MANTLLKVYPPELMNFSRAENSKEIIITNVAKVDVTFKLQSTVFGKFKMQPRWGVLKPNEYTHVLITKCKDAELSKKGRDKILVVCMTAPINEVDFDTTAAFWRHNICFDSTVEKHPITCLQAEDNVSTAGDSVSRQGVKEPKEATKLFSVRTVGQHWR